ncbi:hypothetical protein JCM6882_004048 [Rhodosporidiobolus microsporus]
MPVLVTSLHPSPDFGPLHPVSSPVTTYPYPSPAGATATTRETPDIVLSGSTSKSSAGPPLLAVVLPCLLGTLAILVALYALARWATREERRRVMGETEAKEGKEIDAEEDKKNSTASSRSASPFRRHAPPLGRGRFIEILDLPNKPPPAYKI